MKVLMFGWEFPPHISGGLGTACFGLTRSLVAHGDEILFVLPKVCASQGHAPKPCHVQLIDAGSVPPASPAQSLRVLRSWQHRMHWLEVDSPLRAYSVPTAQGQAIDIAQLKEAHEQLSRTQDVHGLLSFSGSYSGDLLGDVMRFSLVGARLGASETFDVIHAHDWMTALAGASAKAISGKPLVFHVHGTEFDRAGDNRDTRVMALEEYGMQMADKIIAVSQRTKDIVVEKYHIDPSKIEVVHNGVEKDKALSRADIPFRFNDKVVLFLGRVTYQKGPEYFVKTAKVVLQRWRAHKTAWGKDGVEGVRFVMAGAGDLLPQMVEYACAMYIADRFHFTGFLRGTDVDRMFATCDLYVLPSVSEPFGITPLEAMKYDVPVILSKQSGVAEILPHVESVHFWDVRATARAIEKVLRSNTFTQSQIKHNHHALDHITWDGAAKRVRAVYGALMSASPASVSAPQNHAHFSFTSF